MNDHLVNKGKKFMQIKIIWFLVLTLVPLSLTYAASHRDDSDREDVEVYDSKSNGNNEEENSEYGRAEIRLSRPEEAAKRIADNEGYEMVPGVDRLLAQEKVQTLTTPALQVPSKSGRAIASVESTPISSKAPTEIPSEIPSEIIEPQTQALAQQEMRQRISEQRSEVLVASNRQPGKQASAIGSELRSVDITQIDPALPSGSGVNRNAVQEISVIVSDQGYFPNRLFVTQGTQVRLFLTTTSKNTLCFMLDKMGVKKGVQPSKVEEVLFTPEVPGDYRFYCPVKSIDGILTVRETPRIEQSLRGLASGENTNVEPPKPLSPNEPKNAPKLRALIED